MSLQQVAQPKSSSNVVGHRRVDRELGVRQESKLLFGKQFSSNSSSLDHINGNSTGRFHTPSHDRLIFASICLIGHSVEVHVKNGSTISGIFHATNAERDFGIVLKMARVVKDGSLKGQTVTSDVNKRPQTMIIPGRELVQVIAKDVLLTGDEPSNEPVHEKHQDLMIDSAISLSHCVEERELERWAPDNDDPQCPELDNIFDGTWNRNWDQFQTNETLFGVKSTFNEELYTTKLERGPQMIELEREALRIAREIEGEDIDDLHLAEERGANIHEDYDLDEESRFSAVHRVVGDYTYDGDGNTMFDKRDADSFGGSFDTIEATSFNGTSNGKMGDVAQTSPSYLQMDDETSHSAVTKAQDPHSVDQEHKLIPVMGHRQFMAQNGENNIVDGHAKKNVCEKAQSSKLGERQSSSDMNASSANKESLFIDAKQSPSYIEENKKTTTGSHTADSGKTLTASLPVNSRQHFGSSTSPKSKGEDNKSVSASPVLSPSSSLGSLSSAKSTLNPYAKEFKLNPHAKAFKPSSSLRPHSPAAETSVYYGTNTSVPYMHGLPLGVGIGSSFSGHQPVYNPQAINIQSPQAYLPSNAPMYGQQMMLGQPRPYVLMPTYPPEMPYRGREF